MKAKIQISELIKIAHDLFGRNLPKIDNTAEFKKAFRDCRRGSISLRDFLTICEKIESEVGAQQSDRYYDIYI